MWGICDWKWVRGQGWCHVDDTGFTRYSLLAKIWSQSAVAASAVFWWPASSTRRANPYSWNSGLGQRILITVRIRWENVPHHPPAPGLGDHPHGVRDIRDQCKRSSRITGIIRGDRTPGQSLVDHLQGKVFTDLQGNCWGPYFKTIKKQKPIHSLCCPQIGSNNNQQNI